MIIKFLVAALAAGTPLMFGTLGEILTEKSGNLNLGVEGIMAIGAIAGFYFGYASKSALLALFGAFIAGMAASLVYTFLTATLKANQNVTGLTLTIFGVGLSNFFGDYLRERTHASVLKLEPALTDKLANIHIPVLSDIPVLGPLLFQFNPLVYLAILLCILAGIYLHHTRAGLNTRAVGENPAAADATGINVSRVKYINTLLGGGISALGGAYIALILCGGVWVANCVNGMGWIAVALVIFAKWNPFLCILGSGVFGAFQILKFYLPQTIRIPDPVYTMLPFLIVAIVLIVTSMRKSKTNQQPASCGVNYFREER